MVKIGIAGLGFIGKMHLATARKNMGMVVVAVADKNPLNLSNSAGGVGNIALEGDMGLDGVKKYDSADKLLDDPNVEAVILALPTYLHKEYVLKAAARNKHIFCEKPFTLTATEGEEVIAALQGYAPTLMVGQCIRFWPAYVKAAEIIQDNTYGAFRSAHLQRSSSKPSWSWENWILDEKLSGGAILDLHIHDIDWVQHVLGTPDDIEVAGVRDEKEGWGQVTTLCKYSDGRVVSIDGGWDYPAAFPFRMAFRIQLEHATLEFSTMNDGLLHLFTQDGEDTVIPVPEGDGYSHEHAYFLSCIEGGTSASAASPESALRSIELVERECLILREG